MVVGRRFLAPHTGREGGNGDNDKGKEGQKEIPADKREQRPRTVEHAPDSPKGREEREGHR